MGHWMHRCALIGRLVCKALNNWEWFLLLSDRFLNWHGDAISPLTTHTHIFHIDTIYFDKNGSVAESVHNHLNCTPKHHFSIHIFHLIRFNSFSIDRSTHNLASIVNELDHYRSKHAVAMRDDDIEEDTFLAHQITHYRAALLNTVITPMVQLGVVDKVCCCCCSCRRVVVLPFYS